MFFNYVHCVLEPFLRYMSQKACGWSLELIAHLHLFWVRVTRCDSLCWGEAVIAYVILKCSTEEF